MAEKEISQKKLNKQQKQLARKEKRHRKRTKLILWLKSKMTLEWFKHFSYQVISFIVSVCMIIGVAIYAFNATYTDKVLNLADDFAIDMRTGAYSTEENSMEFIDMAIKTGATTIQIDVRQRPDGTVVMASNLLKINSEGVEIAKVFEKLQDTDIVINLDIKEIWTLKELHKLIVQYDMNRRVFLTGIETIYVNLVKENCPGVDYYINYAPSRLKIFSEDYQNKIIELLDETGAIGINCRHIWASRTLSKVLHKNGYKLSVWTVNWNFEMKRALVNNPDNLITEYPSNIEELIDTWGE